MFVAVENEKKLSFGCLLAMAGILVAVIAIRIYGALNDLWLDEIGSYGIAKDVSSPLDVFTTLHHELNHYFNTLWFWFIGDHGNWPGYRIPSLIAGSGTVVLAGVIGCRRDTTSGLIAMLLIGFSYILILYSSEARGYSMAVFFSFLCYYVLDSFLHKSHWPSAVTFSLSAVLGLLSHPIFISVLLAGLVWSIFRFAKAGCRWKKLIGRIAACYAVPLVFLAVLYWVDMRKIAEGQGTSSPSLLYDYESASAWVLGVSSRQSWKLAACISTIIILCAGIRLLWREKRDSTVFFIGVILVFPLLLILARGSNIVYTRYFVIAIAFLLMLFSFVLASIYRQGKWGRIACIVLIAAYFLVNGQHTLSLFKYGRGHYREAIRLMSTSTKTALITVGGDHDFRIPFVLDFYHSEVPPDKTLKYFDQNSWTEKGPEWFIAHKESFDAPTAPLTQIVGNAASPYELVKVFPATELSGLHWFLYHRAAMKASNDLGHH